jgi:hypothetical protein
MIESLDWLLEFATEQSKLERLRGVSFGEVSDRKVEKDEKGGGGLFSCLGASVEGWGRSASGRTQKTSVDSSTSRDSECIHRGRQHRHQKQHQQQRHRAKKASGYGLLPESDPASTTGVGIGGEVIAVVVVRKR